MIIIFENFINAFFSIAKDNKIKYRERNKEYLEKYFNLINIFKKVLNENDIKYQIFNNEVVLYEVDFFHNPIVSRTIEIKHDWKEYKINFSLYTKDELHIFFAFHDRFGNKHTVIELLDSIEENIIKSNSYDFNAYDTKNYKRGIRYQIKFEKIVDIITELELIGSMEKYNL